MNISQAAFDLIWQEEDGPAGYYAASNEGLPDWPGGYSGVTIGGFYDLGYVSIDEFCGDWKDQLPARAMDALEEVVGLKGRQAHSHARELDGVVNVPEAAARFVFSNREIPKWELRTKRALSNTGKLSPDSLGALVSLAMNRGLHFGVGGRIATVNDRYREMRAIGGAMWTERFDDIPAQFRAMQRLWRPNSGLWKRREHEARLFEKGLSHA